MEKCLSVYISSLSSPSPAGRPFINAEDGTDRADLTTNQLLIDAAEVRGACLLHTFVLPNTNVFHESVIKGKYSVKKSSSNMSVMFILLSSD